MTYLARHAVVIFSVSAALFGLGMGANGIYQINQDEIHRVGIDTYASAHYADK